MIGEELLERGGRIVGARRRARRAADRRPRELLSGRGRCVLIGGEVWITGEHLGELRLEELLAQRGEARRQASSSPAAGATAHRARARKALTQHAATVARMARRACHPTRPFRPISSVMHAARAALRLA